MTIHKEGRSILLFLLILLILINYSLKWLDIPETVLYFSYLASTIIFLLILQFFRNPYIKIDQKSKLVLAPADGKIVVIEETEETEYLKEKKAQMPVKKADGEPVPWPDQFF